MIQNVTAAGDSCSSPVVMSGPGFPAETEHHFTNAEGQTDPACAGAGGSGILDDGWYVWTSNITGNVRFTCCFSSIPTGDWKAAVYLGGSCPSGAPIACDDNSCGSAGLQPVIDLSMVAGQQYLFQAGRSPGSASSAPMTATFVIAPTDAPTNDECATAQLIQGSGPFAYTLGTTSTITPPMCGPSVGDDWFRWIAPATGTTTFNGCDANFDQAVAVYSGLSCPTASLIVCGDEGCILFLGGPSRFDFPVVCGAPYLVRVSLYSISNPPSWASYPSLGGNFSITVAAPLWSTFTPFCAGDVAANCPCSNPGGVGRGCASSFSNAGGVIYGTGAASLSNDSVTLRVEGVSPSFTTLLQGTAQQGSGAGIAFGDGLLCAGGTLTRLVLRIANGGQLDYPLPGDVSLSVLGQVPTATTRVYQAWYRDSSLGYCMPDTFNLTNGLEVSWTP
ncbi:MAG: hypothetical protein SGI72_07835 [Planctomycetota bacterium]|nr:hypothetical protein [Planctomycetota bacterium]